MHHDVRPKDVMPSTATMPSGPAECKSSNWAGARGGSAPIGEVDDVPSLRASMALAARLPLAVVHALAACGASGCATFTFPGTKREYLSPRLKPHPPLRRSLSTWRGRRANVQIQWLTGLFLAGFVAGAAGEAAAQSANIAYGAAPRTDYVVFLDHAATLSPIAKNMVHEAAAAAMSARTVNVSGSRQYAEVVKGQLVRDGVPAAAVVVTPKVEDGVPVLSDGTPDIAKRRVEISF
ncbi:MAG: hypothetical protein JOY64_20020 [Alphaproteobacteria bacterium]|nr:hypothetical protein [Alphaproteobacteria bacterium]